MRSETSEGMQVENTTDAYPEHTLTDVSTFDSSIDEQNKGLHDPCSSTREEETYQLNNTGEENDAENTICIITASSNEKRKDFYCNICGRTFANNSTLRRHTKLHTGGKHYPCEFCNRAFVRADQLRSHVRNIHIPKSSTPKERIHKCEICEKSYSDKSVLRKHIKLHLMIDRPFKCEACDKTFRRVDYLRKHMKNHSSEANVRPYVCDICGKSFREIEHLREHVKIHAEEKTYICNICNKKFVCRRYLRQHLRTHSEEKPCTCNICNKLFIRDIYLQRHMVRVHGNSERYPCDMCGRTYKARDDMQKHRKTHYERNYCSCDICGKSFHQKALRGHLKCHSEERPYQCDLCQKSFKTCSSLGMHRRMHTGEKPFTCDICGKKFKRGFGLKVHIILNFPAYEEMSNHLKDALILMHIIRKLSILRSMKMKMELRLVNMKKCHSN